MSLISQSVWEMREWGFPLRIHGELEVSEALGQDSQLDRDFWLAKIKERSQQLLLVNKLQEWRFLQWAPWATCLGVKGFPPNPQLQCSLMDTKFCQDSFLKQFWILLFNCFSTIKHLPNNKSYNMYQELPLILRKGKFKDK